VLAYATCTNPVKIVSAHLQIQSTSYVLKVLNFSIRVGKTGKGKQDKAATFYTLTVFLGGRNVPQNTAKLRFTTTSEKRALFVSNK